MTTAEILLAAKARIDKPSKWTQGRLKTPGGRKRCALGAISYACRVDLGAFNPVRGVWERANDRPPGSIAAFNDEHTHEAVLEAFDKAIALAESEEAQP